MSEIKIQMQRWYGYNKALLFTEHGSVQVELWDNTNKFCHSQRTFTAYLLSLWVDKEYRKKGLGKELIEAAEELARKRGDKEIYLEWNIHEAPQWVFNWYRRRGYDEVEFGEGCALMCKKLEGDSHEKR